MEDVSLLRVFVAFAFVIGLILLLSWAAKRLRKSRWAEQVHGKRRLETIEQLYLDSRHKLVLVKCDEVEHLVMIGDGHMVMHNSKKVEA